MAGEREQIDAAITVIESQARAAGKAQAERPALGRRAGVALMRAQAEACASLATSFASASPQVSTAFTDAATRLRQRADVLDPPGP